MPTLCVYTVTPVWHAEGSVPLSTYMYSAASFLLVLAPEIPLELLRNNAPACYWYNDIHRLKILPQLHSRV